jgi:hypothetical protein
MHKRISNISWTFPNAPFYKNIILIWNRGDSKVSASIAVAINNNENLQNNIEQLNNIFKKKPTKNDTIFVTPKFQIIWILATKIHTYLTKYDNILPLAHHLAQISRNESLEFRSCTLIVHFIKFCQMGVWRRELPCAGRIGRLHGFVPLARDTRAQKWEHWRRKVSILARGPKVRYPADGGHRG